MEILAYWLEDLWIGAASAAIFILFIVVARILMRIVRGVPGRQIRDVSAEEPWKPSKDFHMEVSKSDEQNEQKSKK